MSELKDLTNTELLRKLIEIAAKAGIATSGLIIDPYISIYTEELDEIKHEVLQRLGEEIDETPKIIAEIIEVGKSDSFHPHKDVFIGIEVEYNPGKITTMPNGYSFGWFILRQKVSVPEKNKTIHFPKGEEIPFSSIKLEILEEEK